MRSGVLMIHTVQGRDPRIRGFAGVLARWGDISSGNAEDARALLTVSRQSESEFERRCLRREELGIPPRRERW